MKKHLWLPLLLVGTSLLLTTCGGTGTSKGLAVKIDGKDVSLEV